MLQPLTTLSLTVKDTQDKLKFSSFSANGLDFDLLLLKIDKALNLGDFEIAVNELSYNGIHIARCADLCTFSELKELLVQIHSFSNGNFIDLNRAIGTFDNTKIKPNQISDMVHKIAPVAYLVRDNFINGVDIRDKSKYNYVEVGKGVLIGIPKNVNG